MLILGKVVKLAVYLENHYLDAKDTDFIQYVTSDVAYYLRKASLYRYAIQSLHCFPSE